MPVIDKCEPQVINALQKEGWSITHQPFAIKFDDRYVYADIRFQHITNKRRIIVVEVKCFPVEGSAVSEFHRALGQYLNYRIAIEQNQMEEQIFLAIPVTAHKLFQRNKVISISVSQFGVKLIVVDLETEEIKAWIT